MKQGSDVFLSYALFDAAAAAVVRNALEQGGITVYDFGKQFGQEENWDQVRDALTESEAVVLVLDRASFVPNQAVEIGAALAWSKPVFVVEGDLDASELPALLQTFRRFQIAALEPLVEAIQQSKEELSESELSWLATWYSGNGAPLDRVLRDPSALDRLAAEFEKRWDRRIAVDRLLQALLRLRKRGKLPTVGRTSS